MSRVETLKELDHRGGGHCRRRGNICYKSSAMERARILFAVRPLIMILETPRKRYNFVNKRDISIKLAGRAANSKALGRMQETHMQSEFGAPYATYACVRARVYVRMRSPSDFRVKRSTLTRTDDISKPRVCHPPGSASRTIRRDSVMTMMTVTRCTMRCNICNCSCNSKELGANTSSSHLQCAALLPTIANERDDNGYQ